MIKKVWYRRLPKLAKKWLRFVIYAKERSRSRLPTWLFFFQKAEGPRPLFLFKDLTLTNLSMRDKLLLEEVLSNSSSLS